MANNEDVNQANQGAPAADIPDLKKKEKERKKAGAGWGGTKPGGGSFSGATGGVGARAAASAASSLSGAAGVAGVAEAAGAGWLSAMIASLTAMIASLTSTVLGRAILAAGVAAFLIGAGLFGYAMLNGGAGGAGGLGGDLGAISSSMKIRGDGGDRTGYVASNGEIMFDPLKADAAKKAETEKAPEEKGAGEAVLPGQTADAAGKGSGFNWPGLDHNLSGSKLSSSLGGSGGVFGGGSGGVFGGKNIFSGNSAAPKFNEALAKTNIKGGEKGRLSAVRRTATGRTVAGGKARGMKANKAFGQLKLAKGMSIQGASDGVAEGARSTSAGAFDGQTGGSGNVVGGPDGGPGSVPTPELPAVPGAIPAMPSVPGAPDLTVPNVAIPPGIAVDPNTFAMLGAIAAMAKKAGEMKKKAARMMMMGIALIIAGAAMMGIPFIGPIIGTILIALGAMLIGVSIMMSQMASMMKGMADSMSQGLAQRTADIKQDMINKYCIEKAYNEGTDPKNCNPPDSVTENQQVNKNDSDAVEAHQNMVRETGRVEGPNGNPTSQ